MLVRRKLYSFIAIAATLAVMMAILPGKETTKAETQGAVLVGTWYLALDTTPFGIPGATFPALFTFHRDGTFISSDGGDLGPLPFTTLDTSQHGAWVRAGDLTFEATSLFLQKDNISGQLASWHRVHFSLQFGEDFDHINADVTEQILPCNPGPTPFMLFNCPNPITSTFPPFPFHIPAKLTRLRAN